MFTKFLKRSIASSAAVGAVLATAAFASPGTVAAAPQIRNMACGYQGAISTTAGVSVSPGAIISVSSKAVAHVVVTSGAGVPTGRLMLKVSGFPARFYTIHHGKLNKKLPGLKAGHTYTIIARYQKQNCFGSSTGTSYLTVMA